jgi:hypothetical protein
MTLRLLRVSCDLIALYHCARVRWSFGDGCVNKFYAGIAFMSDSMRLDLSGMLCVDTRFLTYWMQERGRCSGNAYRILALVSEAEDICKTPTSLARRGTRNRYASTAFLVRLFSGSAYDA